MNGTTMHFRNITTDGSELSRLFNGLASGEKINLVEGQYLPQHWPVVKKLADLLNGYSEKTVSDERPQPETIQAG